MRHAEILQKQGSAQGRRWLSLTNYNTACMYSLLKRNDEAFEHLFRAVELGSFNDTHIVDLLESDRDFDNIRSDERFHEAVKKAGGGQGGSGGEQDGDGQASGFRGLLGSESDKVRHLAGKTLLWASGSRDSAGGKWYDFTGARVPAEELQFGIGQDSIKSIDDPVFVEPDDPRLLALPVSPYRPGEKPKTTDEIVVIGYEVSGDARAYPAALLDRHELVNDLVGGKPVTVGW